MDIVLVCEPLQSLDAGGVEDMTARQHGQGPLLVLAGHLEWGETHGAVRGGSFLPGFFRHGNPVHLVTLQLQIQKP